ncbi:phospholipid scramblase 2-like isoform X1 [Hypanus sabinus]|uniref:phospholipid scramblase 2-like isoform X1 n=1 Tax=Hypanus sabinus TaxID=79690 RepID=UPI0028C376CD|nr:phospholipid scramblase 2-like isoform X1 [Hypanus sabinus]XP_059820664.1 phospholipid scramblase 2-like isoform X1 [Hypanus sabinus]XP_059820665.1 phospholipid scramblase 2-like isoform X1 [Hypanus sabinus]XP_059820666.1 phospholipid scramblase 2-like isoform X1 [Hypanus sabinus]XP_059820667.1 phospholipid scramblase 2-like isoform X1 [Hypanus sabinus]XP_059820668.1 phospholipid scramblase 2-like isoform X1 [Hypanus sabinus]XP_059820669.1 phospholipid scramblase 2-like isoform X1 [Hypanus
MAAQGLHSYPASEPSAPPYPPVQSQQGPYPPPPHHYGSPPPVSFAGPYAAHPSYVVYHGSSPMVGHQTGVSTQPQAQWMQAPTPIPNCPPGLEYLTLIDQILVHQVTELIEALVGYETKNKYEVKNGLGQRVYYAVEDSEFCNRICCGSNRAFIIKILDNLGRTVMHLVRPLGCGSCCCPCCLHQMEVQAPPGKAIGYIVQEWHPFIPKMSILNESRETVLKIRGPCLTMSCFGDVNFEVVSRDEATVVGKISKQWSGLVREYLTDTDNFGIQFPMDLDVKIKAVLLGACIFVDFMYFEQNSGAGPGGVWQM